VTILVKNVKPLLLTVPYVEVSELQNLIAHVQNTTMKKVINLALNVIIGAELVKPPLLIVNLAQKKLTEKLLILVLVKMVSMIMESKNVNHVIQNVLPVTMLTLVLSVEEKEDQPENVHVLMDNTLIPIMSANLVDTNVKPVTISPENVNSVSETDSTHISVPVQKVTSMMDPTQLVSNVPADVLLVVPVTLVSPVPTEELETTVLVQQEKLKLVPHKV
jgi:hypothetical protein